MDYTFTKDQEMIRKSAREFFIKECPKDRVRELKDDPQAYDPLMWKKMVDLGFLGLIIPEMYGGMQGDLIELMIFTEELGRNLVPCPFFGTVVECTVPLLKFGTDPQKQKYLTGIAEKGAIWSLAQAEQVADFEAEDINLTAEADNGNFVLNGTKLFVPYAAEADFFIVAARTNKIGDPREGVTLFIVEAGAEGIGIEAMPTTARDCRGEVRFDGVRVTGDNVLGEQDQGWTILDTVLQHAAVFKAVEMSGGAQAVFDLTVNYARERKQFNKSIGSFQAVQHKLVDLLTLVDGLKYLVYEAAWHMNNGTSSRGLNSMAKVKANAVYHEVCHHGIVLHGAIGWTEEMDIGLYHIKTKAAQFDGGLSTLHLERIAAELEAYVPEYRKLYPG
ncbi:MAG: acyl-CoA/acyl-ACP dehydrogenase [Deltaproteobacteria bacterium]|nr:acyl-CoA/acyl-ACP dehydrogenase [Deltaproteobacteria bacterium]MBW2676849.1 acyl-CoA/acyl-ACP dehydrogenase [Deltaproteobacteria bacterium]